MSVLTEMIKYCNAVDKFQKLPVRRINEEWDEKMNTNPKDKGMWDGWTVADLKKELTRLKNKKSKSAADKKREKQVLFAIRAKQKNKWGKVNENENSDIFSMVQSADSNNRSVNRTEFFDRCPDCGCEPCECEDGLCSECGCDPCECEDGRCLECGCDPCECEDGLCSECGCEPCECEDGLCPNCGCEPCKCDSDARDAVCHDCNTSLNECMCKCKNCRGTGMVNEKCCNSCHGVGFGQ